MPTAQTHLSKNGTPKRGILGVLAANDLGCWAALMQHVAATPFAEAHKEIGNCPNPARLDKLTCTVHAHLEATAIALLKTQIDRASQGLKLSSNPAEAIQQAFEVMKKMPGGQELALAMSEHMKGHGTKKG